MYDLRNSRPVYQGPVGPNSIQYDAMTNSLVSGPSYGIYSCNGSPIYAAPLNDFFQGPTGLLYDPFNPSKPYRP